MTYPHDQNGYNRRAIYVSKKHALAWREMNEDHAMSKNDELIDDIPNWDIIRPSGGWVGDWWYFAALTLALLDAHGIAYRQQAEDTGLGMVIAVDGGAYNGARIRITGRAGTTHLKIVSASDFRDRADALKEFLLDVARRARTIRRANKPTADDVVEIYYRSRAAGSKVTLKQLAEEYELNASYLRTVKAAYDKAGKWGAKSASKVP